MSLRLLLERLRREEALTIIAREVNPQQEAAALIRECDGRPIFFERVSGSEYPAVGGVAGSRRSLAMALGAEESELLGRMAAAPRTAPMPSLCQPQPTPAQPQPSTSLLIICGTTFQVCDPVVGTVSAESPLN